MKHIKSTSRKWPVISCHLMYLQGTLPWQRRRNPSHALHIGCMPIHWSPQGCLPHNQSCIQQFSARCKGQCCRPPPPHASNRRQLPGLLSQSPQRNSRSKWNPTTWSKPPANSATPVILYPSGSTTGHRLPHMLCAPCWWPPMIPNSKQRHRGRSMQPLAFSWGRTPGCCCYHLVYLSIFKYI